jgi:hypothetical protein
VSIALHSGSQVTNLARAGATTRYRSLGSIAIAIAIPDVADWQWAAMVSFVQLVITVLMAKQWKLPMLPPDSSHVLVPTSDQSNTAYLRPPVRTRDWNRYGWTQQRRVCHAFPSRHREHAKKSSLTCMGLFSRLYEDTATAAACSMQPAKFMAQPPPQHVVPASLIIAMLPV